MLTTMTPASYVVWEWVDPDLAEPVYVGVGKLEAGQHPADHLWALRHAHGEEVTPLMLWLRKFNKEPRRNYPVGSKPLHKDAAYAFALTRRRMLRDEGIKLLSNRPSESFAGGGASRAVFYEPDTEIFPSVRQAAEAHGVKPATITRRCQEQRGGWRYWDDMLLEDVFKPEHVK